MITSSGAVCDVCGHYILPITGDELVNHFTVKQVDKPMICCNPCKSAVQNCGGEWAKLPDGPLRKLFSDESNKREQEAKMKT